MKNRKSLYYAVNISFLLLSLLLVNYTKILNMKFSIDQVLILIILAFLIHIFKFIRIYFILLEERISFRRMIKIYIKTTFVSIVLPYKSGEIFKMYSYGYEIKNYFKGIISVLIDKFFDAVILCAVLVPYGIIKNGNVSSLALIMLTFLIILSIIYLSFEGTYYYLNRFFILKSRSKKGLFALNMLERMNFLYIKAKEMLKGRQLVLLCITSMTWIIESIFIYIMSGFMNINIEFITVINYISDAFFGIDNVLFNNYIYLCTAIFLAIIICIYFKKIIDGGKKCGKNSTNV